MITKLRALGPALPVLALVQFVSQLGIAIMLPLLPLYGLSLGASPLELGLMTSAFSITNALAQVGSGYLLDRFGSRRFLSAGTAIYAVANVLIAVAQSATMLVAFRGLAGIGGGVNLVASQVYISSVVERARLAFFNSVLSAARSAGSVFGPALGGLIAANGDLRAPFFIVAATSAVAFVASLFLPRPQSVAHPSAALGGTSGLWSRTVLTLLVGNMLLLVGFGSWITTYSPFATERLGWSTFDVGIIFTLFGLGDITLGPWLGHLADRTGRRRMAVLASIPIFLFGFVLVLGLPKPFFYAISFVTGASLTAYNASWFALLTAAIPAERRGRIFGVVMAVGQAGTVAGALGASVLWQAFGVQWGLLVGSFAALFAGIVLLALPRDASPARRGPAPADSPA
ncbi:MAG TPA: MFS transporter [Candidatus Limnocylindrales bacterium]|nr:MFS transporter [Candidatus Limnocylindrales bacterium]